MIRIGMVRGKKLCVGTCPDFLDFGGPTRTLTHAGGGTKNMS